MTDKINYEYDVFISYRWVDPDQGWVRNQLGPALQSSGLKVLIDVEDFIPGRDLILEMTRAGAESRRAICVLSPDYVDPDRMVNFEALMLRRFDPAGQYSRLIPLVIRKTEVPEHIRGLIAIDWTEPSHHAREWGKLLKVLEAPNRNASPPGSLESAQERLPRPIPGPIPGPTRRSSSLKVPLVALASIVLIAILSIVANRACSSPKLRTVEGRVYHERVSGNSALIPVENVVVFLSQKPDVKSEPTGPDGRFILRGIPAGDPIDLTAKYGTQDFKMGYQDAGDYPVIPRPNDNPSDLEFIRTPWIEKPTEQCLPDDGQPITRFKVYSLDVDLPANQGKPEAVLTVELLESPETTIRSAHVRTTPRKLYRNESVQGEDRTRSHTWVFQLPPKGLKTKLDICLGSDNPGADISKEGLSTYYKLQ